MELENGSSHRGLTASRLTNDTEGLTGIQLEGYVINCDKLLKSLTGDRLFDREALAEVSYLEECLLVKGLFKVSLTLCLLCLTVSRHYSFIVVKRSFCHFAINFCEYFVFSHCSPPLCKGDMQQSASDLPVPCRGSCPST